MANKNLYVEEAEEAIWVKATFAVLEHLLTEQMSYIQIWLTIQMELCERILTLVSDSDGAQTDWKV